MEKQEIIETRKKGLGSSDAKMVAKIDKNGCLSEPDKFRIAVMLGIENNREFKSVPTEFGNFIEDKIYEIIKQKYQNVVSNPYYKSEKLSKEYGFDIFNHIDYEIETDDRLIWIENKATKKDLESTISEYQDQLKWHGMLLNEKAEKKGKEPVLMLSHYLVDDYNEFNADNFSIKEIKLRRTEDLYFVYGLSIISEAIKEFNYEPREELYADNLPAPIQEKLQQMANCLQEIKEAEAKVEQFKERMKEIMTENNIKSIANDLFKIILVAETVSNNFDKKAFEKEYPELAKKFIKQTKRTSYINIKFN